MMERKRSCLWDIQTFEVFMIHDIIYIVIWSKQSLFQSMLSSRPMIAIGRADRCHGDQLCTAISHD